MRLIDGDALQKLFNEVSSSLLCRRDLAKDTEHMVRAFLMVTEMIQDAPTVDAVPVARRGRWIEEDGIQICSECGEEHEWEDYRAPYCDTCGAKMDLEEEHG